MSLEPCLTRGWEKKKKRFFLPKFKNRMRLFKWGSGNWCQSGWEKKPKHFKMSGKEDFLLGKIGRKGDTLVGIHSTCPTKVDGRKKKDK